MDYDSGAAVRSVDELLGKPTELFTPWGMRYQYKQGVWISRVLPNKLDTYKRGAFLVYLAGSPSKLLGQAISLAEGEALALQYFNDHPSEIIVLSGAVPRAT